MNFKIQQKIINVGMLVTHIVGNHIVRPKIHYGTKQLNADYC